uniref:AMP-dependent synthetase/ligase domain-containing protein n=1 Tax=Anopheles christyi TaxID=43041 RepID=A0A182JX55_9DIPT
MALRLLGHYQYQRASWYSRILQSIRTQSTDASGGQEKGQSYIHHIGSKPLVYRNVGQHLRLAAERFPNNEAIVSCHEAGARLTYAAVLDKVDRLAASFYQLGLQQGDRVGIWAPNGMLFYLTNLAAARAGMITVSERYRACEYFPLYGLILETIQSTYGAMAVYTSGYVSRHCLGPNESNPYRTYRSLGPTTCTDWSGVAAILNVQTPAAGLSRRMHIWPYVFSSGTS